MVQPALVRRQMIARPVVSCRQPDMLRSCTEFRYSQCIRNRSPSEFKIQCGTPPRGPLISMTSTVEGLCRVHETCIDVDRGPGRVAWCASRPSLTAAFRGSRETPISRFIGHARNPRGGDIIQVILTRQNRRDELYEAFGIVIVPADRNENVLAPPSSCRFCSSLRFFQTPPGTTDIHILIIARSPEDAAVMSGYVWQV